MKKNPLNDGKKNAEQSQDAAHRLNMPVGARGTKRKDAPK